MDAEHHDLVLAITSHVPHLIAYNIVNTARHLERVTDTEVIKFSAGGFRDFTRIAASDPVMWRDVFLNNKEAVLEMLGRFSEDLTALQRAIRFGDGDTLYKLFVEARAVRRGIIEAGQDTAAPDFGRHGTVGRMRRRAGQEAIRSMSATDHDLWVFGYGSLMWRPGFAYEEARRARVTGYRRCFCIYSVHHRGTPERPGHGAGARPRRRLRGHRLSRRARRMRLRPSRYLRAREQVNGVYREAHAAGRDHGGPNREVMALTYIVERAHPNYAGRLPLAVQARLIRGGAGHLRRQPRLPDQHAAAPGRARHPRARAGAHPGADRPAYGARAR